MRDAIPASDVLRLRDEWRREARQIRALARAEEDESALEADVDRTVARLYEQHARQLARLLAEDGPLFEPAAPEATGASAGETEVDREL